MGIKHRVRRQSAPFRNPSSPCPFIPGDRATGAPHLAQDARTAEWPSPRADRARDGQPEGFGSISERATAFMRLPPAAGERPGAHNAGSSRRHYGATPCGRQRAARRLGSAARLQGRLLRYYTQFSPDRIRRGTSEGNQLFFLTRCAPVRPAVARPGDFESRPGH